MLMGVCLNHLIENKDQVVVITVLFCNNDEGIRLILAHSGHGDDPGDDKGLFSQTIYIQVE